MKVYATSSCIVLTILKTKMIMIYNKVQQEIAQKIDNKAEISDWTNWNYAIR